MNALNVAKMLVTKCEEHGYKASTVSKSETEVADEMFEILKSYTSETAERDLTLDIDHNEPPQDSDLSGDSEDELSDTKFFFLMENVVVHSNQIRISLLQKNREIFLLRKR